MAGLSPYWQDPHSKRSIEWKKWNDLFSVAMTAKHPISTAEVLRHVANETDRKKALLNNLNHAVAERKSVIVLYISLEAAARRLFMDKYPNGNSQKYHWRTYQQTARKRSRSTQKEIVH